MHSKSSPFSKIKGPGRFTEISFKERAARGSGWCFGGCEKVSNSSTKETRKRQVRGRGERRRSITGSLFFMCFFQRKARRFPKGASRRRRGRGNAAYEGTVGRVTTHTKKGGFTGRINSASYYGEGQAWSDRSINLKEAFSPLRSESPAEGGGDTSFSARKRNTERGRRARISRREESSLCGGELEREEGDPLYREFEGGGEGTTKRNFLDVTSRSR